MQKVLNYNGYKISYLYLKAPEPKEKVKAIDGPLTLMLVHGFPERGNIFHAQVAALAPYYNLLVPDLPGSGDSPFNPTLKSVADFADALEFIIATEQINKLVITGHSMGGYIALAFAEKYPERLSGLGLLHSTAFADSNEKKANRLKAIRTMQSYGGPAFLKSMIPALFGDSFTAAHPEIIHQLILAGDRFETSALQQYYQIMHDRIDRTILFTRLSVPFLFVSGTQDKAAPAADIITQSTLPEIAMIDILEETGHMGFIEKPARVNQLLTDFLSLVQTMQHRHR